MCHIRFLEIHICLDEDDYYLLSFIIRSLFINLTSPAALEHLEFNIEFSRIVFYDSLPVYDNLRDTDLWRHLDTIATHPTYSKLQRVDINIRYAYDVDEPDVDSDKVKEAVVYLYFA